MAEAVGLVKTLDSWTVVDQLILSTKTPEKKLIFGKGNFQYLTGDLRSSQIRPSVSLASIWSHDLFQRRSGKQQGSPLCLWMWSVCLLCLRWAPQLSICALPQTLTVLCLGLEGIWGSLGGQSLWQIFSCPSHFSLQRQNQRGQAANLPCRDPLVKVTAPSILLVSISPRWRYSLCFAFTCAADPDWKMKCPTWISRVEDRGTSAVQVRHLYREKAACCGLQKTLSPLCPPGETLYEVQQRLLKEREAKIRSALEKLRRKRHLLRSQRKHREFPIISVLGYTNCGERSTMQMLRSQVLADPVCHFILAGKTTLIKALTGDSGLQPRNQLFATLDVTVHAGQLPSHMPVLYVDTIGFLSQLPHQLIDSFSATLEDIKHSVWCQVMFFTHQAFSGTL